ncbi:PAS domain S-box protein [Hymenobacter sp. 102]|uniref:PAS domain-containing sensor histidine kinase n=1 Tax=Hymenobacter sp. 102 TaxID=3403152 RepID=UPI003CF9904E
MSARPSSAAPAAASAATPVSADWLLDSLPSGVLVLDAQGRILRLNRQVAAWWGLPAGQLIQQLLPEVPAAALPPELLRALRQLLAGQQLPEATYFLPHCQQWLRLSCRQQPAQCVVYWQPVDAPAPAAHPPQTGLREALATYQELFQATEEGFCVIEVLFDEQGKAVDYRFLDTNPAFERQSGLQNVLGRCISELVPALEPHWFAMYEHVALTGEPRRNEQWVGSLRRWFDVFAFRVAEPHRRCVAVMFRDETPRKRMQDALRQSEEQFRVVANLVPDLLWTNTTEGATDWCNQRWLDYTGQTMEQVCGYGWIDVIHPDDRAGSTRSFLEAVRAGQPLHLEHRIRSAAGPYRWFLVQMVPFTRQGQDVVQWVGAATDIHERKLAEAAVARHKQQLEQQVAERTQALQESQALLHSVFEASINSVTVLKAVRDAAGELVDFEYVISNQIARLYNNGVDTSGASYTQLHPGVKKTLLFDRFKEVVATGQRLDLELFYGYEDINHWFRVVGARLGDGLVVTAENISDRKAHEQEQVRSLQLLQEAEEVAAMGSWEYYLAEGRIKWSAGMYRLYHWAPDQAPTPSVYLQYATPESSAAAGLLVQQLLAGTTGFEQTLRLRVGGTEKTVRVKAVVVPEAEGRPARLVGMDVDISKGQRLEQENLRLRLTQQQELFAAVQQAREAERRRVAEGLHNGVGQILYATKLRLEQLSAFARQFTPEAKAAYQESSQLLGEAMRQIRGLSHELVPHILESFGLTSAFQDIGYKLSSPRLRLECRSTLAEGEHMLSETLQLALYRIAQELAQNIVKHAHGATRAWVQLDADAEGVILRAEDNGAGFTPDVAQSTGLGLRSIRNQVKLLGGTITIQSEPAKGVKIRLYIPFTGLVIL